MMTMGGKISHPVMQNFGCCPEGGTEMVAYSKLASLHFPELSDMDYTGQTCWIYTMFSGCHGHLTTVLIGCNRCRSQTSHVSSSYKLHQAYLMAAKRYYLPL
jgi:hypothetical protein